MTGSPQRRGERHKAFVEAFCFVVVDVMEYEDDRAETMCGVDELFDGVKADG
jgi:hypothetical protein